MNMIEIEWYLAECTLAYDDEEHREDDDDDDDDEGRAPLDIFK